MKIAIDVGGVLTRYEGRRDVENPVINVDGALEVLKEWKSQGYELYIVSFCKKKSAIYRSEKLKMHGQDELFKMEWYVEDKFYKSDVIAWIQPDIMIDDNEAVLTSIGMKNKKITSIMFQEFNDQQKKKSKMHKIANCWKDVKEIVDKEVVRSY